MEKVLDNIGLQQHAHTFKENDVDYETFLNISGDDLREFNLPFGHRIKIRSEIDRLKRLDVSGKKVFPAFACYN